MLCSKKEKHVSVLNRKLSRENTRVKNYTQHAFCSIFLDKVKAKANIQEYDWDLEKQVISIL